MKNKGLLCEEINEGRIENEGVTVNKGFQKEYELILLHLTKVMSAECRQKRDA